MGLELPSATCDVLRPLGTSVFAEMTRLAQQHGAVNLAQGFPDFDGPETAKAAAVAAVRAGHSQYARMFGLPLLNRAIAESWNARTGAGVDPDRHVTVTSGCTEAIAATLLGLLNPGDEIVIFEPFYDSYRACVGLARATARFVALRPQGPGEPFGFDERELRAAFTARTRAILLNTPHNPTGKVFSRDEMVLIAALCQQHGAVAITDEVYEYLTYDPLRPHIPMATIPGMEDRTITLSSLGKTFSLTGWKVGWAIAPDHLTAAVRAAHQFLTFTTATPLQHGAAAIIAAPGDEIARVRALYMENRDTLAATLDEIGFTVFPSHGTYFMMADHTRLGRGDDVALCRYLAEHVKVAAIPPTAFYDRTELGRGLLRFAFCKKKETIADAVARLRVLAPAR
ncbi:MAG: aminotransferase class I/II-fold pyridoxal phosphate-dependent enzyme [Phycisphaerales bacterium]